MPSGAWRFSHTREVFVGDSGVIGYRGTHAPDDCLWFNHMSAESIRFRVGEAVWSEYFKFCVVRNPFEKLVSAFYFFERPGFYERAPAAARDGTPSDIIDRFRVWMAAGRASEWIDRDKYVIEGAVCVDFFIRYEDLETGLHHVCDRLQIPTDLSRLPRLKVSNRDPKIKICDYYDCKTIEIVEDVFGFELANFNYSLAL